MFYEPRKQNPKTDMGLAYDPWKALVQPRPIGWISTISPDGKANLAPYSFYNAISVMPPPVMFSSSSKFKDTARNILETGEFVVNIVTADLLEPMAETGKAVPYGVDEFDLAGLTKRESKTVRVPAVAESPAHLECKLYKTVELPPVNDEENYVVFIGEVTGIYIADDIIQDGRVDFISAGRLGYFDYSITDKKITVTPNKR
jgi:flavin reductase (DIM6/NTAB) family NADH-FMN oxidoreductase RutF